MSGKLEHYNQQINTVLHLLEGRQLSTSSKEWGECIKWVRFFPKGLPESRRIELLTAIQRAFGATEEDIINATLAVPLRVITPQHPPESREAKLRKLIPPNTWLDWYAEYTQHTESPLSFHIFSSLCVLGAALGRRAFKSMGFYSVFPNYNVVLIGPTGRVKKTSAVNVATNLINTNGVCPVMADKLTPEAMLTALKASGHQYIPVPEFAVFFNRQKYNEGLTQQIIRMLDCPEQFKLSTQSRGEEIIENVALTMLAATTPSLLNDSSAREATSSGFLNRFLLVVEHDTERCQPNPKKGSEKLGHMLNGVVQRLKDLQGELTFSPEAAAWWEEWYRSRWKLLRTLDEASAGAIERGQDHSIRTAMLLHLATHDTFEICQSCLELGTKLVEFVEEQTPNFIRQITENSNLQDTGYIIQALTALKGMADHSTLLRRCINKGMTAATFKQHMQTLIESGQVHSDMSGPVRLYRLQGE